MGRVRVWIGVRVRDRGRGSEVGIENVLDMICSYIVRYKDFSSVVFL